MPELGLSPAITVDSPVGPTFTIAPPGAADVIVVAVSGPSGAPGQPGAPGGDGTEDPPVDLTVLFENALA